MNGIEHGGPDASHPVRHDFSTNANPLGPPLLVLDALQHADRSRYPDPDYAVLREQLGAWHGLDATRVLPDRGHQRSHPTAYPGGLSGWRARGLGATAGLCRLRVCGACAGTCRARIRRCRNID